MVNFDAGYLPILQDFPFLSPQDKKIKNKKRQRTVLLARFSWGKHRGELRNYSAIV